MPPSRSRDTMGPVSFALAGYARVALALILDPSGGLFSDAARPPVIGSLPVPSIYSSARPELDRSPVCRDHACMISSFVRAQPLARPQTQTLSY